MASKNKRREDKAPGAGNASLRQDVDRLIAKERYKDAVKEAKLCYRQDSTPEHHQLLEQAYFLRARQLQQGAMPSAAQEVAQHLLDFGITDPELNEPAAALLLVLGMAGPALKLQERLVAPEARDRLNRQAADQVVLHPERVKSAPAEIQEGALRVRTALERLVAGDADKALDALRDLPRNSPFGDWKLFVRGFAAFRRRDQADTRANWERLDSTRAASRIARALATLDEPASGSRPTVPKLDHLERLTFGEPILGSLRELGALMDQKLWIESLRVLAPLRFALRRLDPSFAVRVTQVLYLPIIMETSNLNQREAISLTGTFTRIAEPLPIDPQWNRFMAMVWDGPKGIVTRSEPYWLKYLDDLKASTVVRPEDLDRAQALIWWHLGDRWLDYYDEFDWSETRDPEALQMERETQRRVVRCLEESLRLCPTHRPTYETLVDAYRTWEKPDAAVEVLRRQVEALPNDFEAWIELAEHDTRRARPEKALDALKRARALKPLDQTVLSLEWSTHLALARQYALDGRWNEGRAEFEAAEQLRPDKNQDVSLLAGRAAFERKAGQVERADAIIAGTVKALVDPSPLWLALTIEAHRYALPVAEQDRFEATWRDSLKKKARAETGGALANLLEHIFAGEVVYPHRDQHARLVVEYLQRTTRLKYERDPLYHACQFLERNNESDLLEKLAKRGTKLFPNAPEFPLFLSAIAIKRGPNLAELNLMRRHLETALKLAQAHESSDPRAALLLPTIKKTISMMVPLMSFMQHQKFDPGGPGRKSGSPFFGAFANLFGIHPEDDDEEDDAPPSSSAPPGRNRGKT